MTYDVIVTGLGGMGSAAAYQLADRGKRVLGLERFTPPHEEGSSHGQSRIIRQAYFEAPAYVPLLLRAYELWERLERDSGEDILTITGGLMMGSPESETVAGSARSAREYDIPHSLLEASEIERRFPVLVPAAGTVALYENRAGFLRPEASVRAHLDLASRLGAELRFGEKIVSWRADSSGDGVRVETESGAYEAERLIVSVGAWASELLPDLRLPLQVERQVMYWFDPVGGVEPFLPERFPIFIWEPEDGNTFYGVPAHDGPRGGVKAAFYRAGGFPCSPETIDREVHEEEVEHIRGYLLRYVPELNGTLLDTKTCMYTNTPDLHFCIFTHPHHSQVAIAAGFSGHGYKFASVIGEILADLALDGSTRHPIGLFAPERLETQG